MTIPNWLSNNNTKPLQIFLILCLFSLQVFALKEFQVSKLLQYSSNSTLHGSQRASFNLLATFPTITVETPHRRVLLLPLPELQLRIQNYENNKINKNENENVSNNNEENQDGKITLKNEEFQTQIFGEVGGVLVIISEEDRKNEEFKKGGKWEHHLLSHKLTIPVYFIDNSEDLQQIIESARTETVSTPSSVSEVIHWILSDSHQLSISSTEPYPLKTTPSISNIQTVVFGSSKSSNIVIFGHYDTFTASVGLSNGPQSASSASSFLELIRLFNNLYNGSKLSSKYNFVFVLSSGNQLNYFGSKQWLGEQDERFLKSIEFVLSLDSLLSLNENDRLFLHSSRPVKDPVAQKLYSSFSAAAKQFGINFEVDIKRINLLQEEDSWEHEHFSVQRILAATITSEETSKPLFSRSSILDSKDVNLELLCRNIRFVAESLGRFIFEAPESESLSIFEGSLAVNENFVNGWINALISEVRVTPYISEDLSSNLERAIKSITGEAVRKSYAISNYGFFTLPTTNVMTVSLVKPFVFDVALSIVLFAYLYLVFLFFKHIGDSFLE